MNKFVFCFAIFSIILFGCGKNKSMEEKLIVKKFDNGKIMEEAYYINDSIKHGIAKSYYRNGILATEIDYKNGQKEGWVKVYYIDGKVSGKVQFKAGLQDGLKYLYFENGKVKEESNWIKDKAFGNALFYYENGRLETYNCYDFDQRNRYLIKYDSNGTKLKEIGRVLGQLLFEYHFDTIPVNKPINAKVSVAVPPDTQVDVIIGKLVTSELKEIRQLPVEKNMAIYQETFLVKGRHTLIFIGEMKDSRGTVLKRDSIKTDITVID
jgi:antitoxin component YwqK of YwqJK toxin-antitoxin module